MFKKLIFNLLTLHCIILESIGMLYAFLLLWAELIVAKSSDYGEIVIAKTVIGNRILLLNDGVIHSIHNFQNSIPEGYCNIESGIANILLNPNLITNTARIALIGMGCGTVLYYARKNQQWSGYEINPIIIELASNNNLFNFVNTCVSELTIFCTDGFTSITPSCPQNVIIIDAFFGALNLASVENLTKLIHTVDINTIFILHVSGLIDKDIVAIVKLGISCGFTALIKETPMQNIKLGKCSMSDFVHPFYSPAKWLVMLSNYEHVSTLYLIPGWEILNYHI